MKRRLSFVFVGLTLSSSWGNGHATTYRALLKALGDRGHDILFLECDRPWYAAERDLADPSFCRLAFYDEVADLHAFRAAIESADLVVVGSFVADGARVIRRLRPWARRLAFYDIDTPVTLAALDAGECPYLAPDIVPCFDHYLSFTGGPTLRRLERDYGARDAQALFCAVDPALYGPAAAPLPARWSLGYLGTYSIDRQPMLERLLLEPARRRPDLRFVVAGPQYPASIAWPSNVDRIEHVPPGRHAEFYNSLAWTLNVTRADMIEAGYSPSVRLFEAGACATPIVSDPWPGIGTFFRIGSEIRIAEQSSDILPLLEMMPERRRRIGIAARARVLAEHTAAARALALERVLEKSPAVASPGSRAKSGRPAGLEVTETS